MLRPAKLLIPFLIVLSGLLLSSACNQKVLPSASPIPRSSEASAVEEQASPTAVMIEMTAAPPTQVALPDGDYTQVVEDFYAWYLSYRASHNQRSPLSDQSYQSSPFLSQAMIDKADLLLASPPEVWNSDPFLCAQIDPPQLKAVSGFANQGRPLVVASIPHPSYYFVADLVPSPEGVWLIDDIHCNFLPEGTVSAYFAWILEQNTGGKSLVEALAFQESAFLAGSFRDELGRRLAAGEDFENDPVFGAINRIISFEHEPCPEEGCLLAHLKYSDETSQTLQVQWENVQGQIQITGIQPVANSQSSD